MDSHGEAEASLDSQLVKTTEVGGIEGFDARTFGWLGRYRRLNKDYEVLTETSEAMIRLAMIHVMVRRLEPMSQSYLAPRKSGETVPQAS